MTYDEARPALADWLCQHATTGSGLLLSDGYDLIDSLLPRNNHPHWKKIYVALSFWDGWIDASNHDWQYYEPINVSDWPVLAREIAHSLRTDADITNPKVLRRFS